MPPGRPAAAPRTALGTAMRRKRGALSIIAAAAEADVSDQMFARFERGTHEPRVKVAEKLATWLGWSVGAVIDAARRPAE